MLALAAGALALAGLQADARAATRRAVLCQHQHGHTLTRRGSVRIFEVTPKEGLPGEGLVYGCLLGSTHTVALWDVGADAYAGPERDGSVKQIDGRFVLIESYEDNQYAASYSLEAFDLRSGASYSIAGASEPISPASSHTEERPAAYVLGPNGRTAVLLEQISVAVAPGSNAATATGTGEVLELLGFHRFRDVIATTPPKAIEPGSLRYDGHAVNWTQEGGPHSWSS